MSTCHPVPAAGACLHARHVTLSVAGLAQVVPRPHLCAAVRRARGGCKGSAVDSATSVRNHSVCCGTCVCTPAPLAAAVPSARARDASRLPPPPPPVAPRQVLWCVVASLVTVIVGLLYFQMYVRPRMQARLLKFA